MSKRFKGIKPKLKYIIPLVAITSLLGTSYGYWGDTLKIESNISTGKLMVSGVDQEDWKPINQNGPYSGTGPKHNRVGYGKAHNCYLPLSHDSEEETVDDQPTGAFRVNKKGENDWSELYLQIQFKVKNTGSIPAKLSLHEYKSSQDGGWGYKKTWIKFLDSSNETSVDNRYDFVYEETNGSFFNDINVIQIDDTPVGTKNLEGTVLKPGETALCQIEVIIPEEIYKKDNYEITKYDYMESQFCIDYIDVNTGAWIGDTCNSIFVKRNFNAGEEAVFKYARDHGSSKALEPLVPTPLPDPIPQPEGPSDGEILPLPRPIPLPEPEGPSDGEILPLPKPIPLPDPIPEPEGPSGGEVLPLPKPEEVPTPLPLPRPEEVPMPLPEVSVPIEDWITPEIPVVESATELNELNDGEEQVVSPQGGENQ